MLHTEINSTNKQTKKQLKEKEKEKEKYIWKLANNIQNC